MEINLKRLTKGEVRNLSGQERGVQARAMFRLDEADVLQEPVRVVVPDELDGLTTSFFQGMFAGSVRHFGSREAFLAHYSFDAGPLILLQIERGLRTLFTRRHSALAVA
jgi:hypothetical protein